MLNFRGKGADATERDGKGSEQEQRENPPESDCSHPGSSETPVSESNGENREGEQQLQLDSQEQLVVANKKLAEAETKISDLRSRIQTNESSQEELMSRLQRLQADFDNFRRRTEKEKEEIVATASSSVVEKILPVLDNFERAAATEVGDEAAFREGMDMIFNQLMTVLEESGLEPCNAVGCPFDPNLHHAVAMVEDDSCEDNTVVEELQKGYLLSGKVIRPAMVNVSRKQ